MFFFIFFFFIFFFFFRETAWTDSILRSLSRVASNRSLDLEFRWCLRVVVDWCLARTMDNVLESHVTVASTLERSIVRIGYLKSTVVTSRERNANR